MKISTKKKAVEILDKIIEKCGGPGGTPGPCPTGATKDSYERAARVARVHTREAVAMTRMASQGRGTSGQAEKHSLLAMRASQAGSHSGTAEHHTKAAAVHLGNKEFKAASAHELAAKMHTQAQKVKDDLMKQGIYV